MRHQRGEGDEHTIEVQLPEGVRHCYRAGIAAWGLERYSHGWVSEYVEIFICVGRGDYVVSLGQPIE